MAQEKAFSNVKRLISSAPVLANYNLNKPVVLQNDGSDYAVNGALLQPNEHVKQPVAFTSSSLNPTEKCFQKFD